MSTYPPLRGIIFDMDGVLLDITQSIRRVNCLAVPFYLRTVLGWPAPDDLLTSADIELFKNAGGFNDDWDLTYAIVLHYLWKGHEQPDASPETLNTLQPNLNRYAARIKDRGGWLRAAEGLVFDHPQPRHERAGLLVGARVRGGRRRVGLGCLIGHVTNIVRAPRRGRRSARPHPTRRPPPHGRG